MIKYIPKETTVVFSEIPDEVTLAINISNCQNNCIGCHSPYLKGNVGEELTDKVLGELIKKNDGISCVCFMGEGNDVKSLLHLAYYVRTNFPDIKVGLYSGREKVEERYMAYFDYIKVGPYIADKGPLDCETTNQRLYSYKEEDGKIIKEDITYKFWKRGI